MSITPLLSSDDGAQSLTKINDNFDDLDNRVPTPGGSDTQIQYNNAGIFEGDANLTFVKTVTGNFDTFSVKKGTARAEVYVRDGGSPFAELFLGQGGSNYVDMGAFDTTTYLEIKDSGEVWFQPTMGEYWFRHSSATSRAFLNFASVTGGNKTFTFPNKSGAVALVENTNTINIPETRTPASSTATGTKGDICWDADYIYVCTATNTWMRAELNTW